VAFIGIRRISGRTLDLIFCDRYLRASKATLAVAVMLGLVVLLAAAMVWVLRYRADSPS
jgi:hypothetical protein